MPSLRALCLFALCTLLPVSAEAATRRIAVVVGSNAGASHRRPLRYAETDAGRMARTLLEVGDIEEGDLFLVQGKPLAEVELAISRAAGRVTEAKHAPDVRTLFLFYFSGHGDEQGLELGNQRLTFQRLRKLLADTDSDVRVGIFDSCESGGAVASKGGKAAAAFTIRLKDSLNVNGEAFLSSSAANESSLESSELGGSYFTSHLITGLRGGADVSGDLRVTLAEAYRYAYDRTVRSTSLMRDGSQHPNFDVRLSGQGELVLSQLEGRSTAKLALPHDAEKIVVVDLGRDQVVAELGRKAGSSLALAAGRYAVRAVRDGQVRFTSVVLAKGEDRKVGWDELKPDSEPIAHAPLARKGSAPAAAASDDSRLRLCVLPFKNATGDTSLDSLSLGFAESISTDFGPSTDIRLIERTQIDVNLKELDFSATSYVDPATRAQLGKIAGAEVVVMGAYQAFGGVLRVNARFIRVETGEVLGAMKEERPRGEVLALQDALAKRVRQGASAVVAVMGRAP